MGQRLCWHPVHFHNALIWWERTSVTQLPGCTDGERVPSAELGLSLGLTPGPLFLSDSIPFYIVLFGIVGTATLPEEPSGLVLTYSFRNIFTLYFSVGYGMNASQDGAAGDVVAKTGVAACHLITQC